MLSPIQKTLFKYIFLITLLSYVTGSFLRYLGCDDYLALYNAWLKSEGLKPGIDFNVDSYSILIDLLTALFYIFPNQFFVVYIERLLLVGIIVLVSYLSAQLAKKFFGKDVALLTFIFTFTSVPLINRGLDIRPDLLTTLAWLALFLMFYDERSFLSKKKIILGSLILVLVFCNKFKAALVVIPLISIFIFRFLQEDNTTRKSYLYSFFWIVISCGIFYSLFLLFICYTDNLGFYINTNFSLFSKVVESKIDIEGGRFNTLLLWLLINPALFIPLCVGFWGFNKQWATFSKNQKIVMINILLCAFLSILLNPSYYPYNLLTLAPMLMFLVSKTYIDWMQSEKVKNTKIFNISLASFIIFLPIINSFPFVVNKLISNSIHHQQALNKFIQNELDDNDAVFAFEGVGLFRPSTYHWRSSLFMLDAYKSGNYSIREEMKDINPVLTIINYRNPTWLTLDDQRFLEENFFPIGTYINAAGMLARTGEKRYQVLVASGDYEIQHEVNVKCLFNNVPVTSGQEFHLEKSHYTLEAVEGGDCLLIHKFNEDSLEKLRNSNPKKITYLITFPLIS